MSLTKYIFIDPEKQKNIWSRAEAGGPFDPSASSGQTAQGDIV